MTQFVGNIFKGLRQIGHLEWEETQAPGFASQIFKDLIAVGFLAGDVSGNCVNYSVGFLSHL